MIIATLYKYNPKAKKTQQWSIEVEGDKFRVTEGYVGFKLTTNVWTTCTPKHVGKKNATTGEAQAIAEAKSKVQKKRDKGYVDDPETKEVMFECTLAHEFPDYESKVVYPAFVSPKLDGMRCLINKDGMWSRGNKPIITCPHIFEPFQKHIYSDPKNDKLIFDGELYAHVLKDDFNKLISLAKQPDATAEDIERAKILEFHMFDINLSENFESRLYDMRSILKDMREHSEYEQIILLPQYKVDHVGDMEDWDRVFVSNGYEGTMVRWGEQGYQFGRTKHLLKVKTFIDKEFEVVGVEAGVGKFADRVGKWIVRLEDGTTSEAGPTGTDELNRQLWIDKDKYIGKMATVKFQGYTKDGKLRFPNWKAIRDKE
jgi:ATP-dependent DNA ligase